LRMEYDREANSAYLRLCDGPVSEARCRTVDIDPWLVDGHLVNIDLDDAGRIVGLEICGATDLLRPEALASPDGSRALDKAELTLGPRARPVIGRRGRGARDS
jgi:uncharacterized protein YuzE